MDKSTIDMYELCTHPAQPVNIKVLCHGVLMSEISLFI